MKARVSLLAGVLAMLASLMPGTGRASPSPGFASGDFLCQIVIAFPSGFTTPAKTNCDGAVWGSGEGLGKGGSSFTFGFEPTKGAIYTGPLVGGKKSGGQGRFENFEAYNVVYSEVCDGIGIVPAVGVASGFAFVNGNDPAAAIREANPARSVVVHFVSTRIGTKWIAVLDAIQAYNNKWPQGGGPKPSLAGGLGIAWGSWIPKPPLGSCGFVNPQQGLLILGHFLAQF